MTKCIKKASSLVMHRFLWCTLFFGLLSVQADGDRAAVAAASPVMNITFSDQLISAELVDAPLIEVLQRIQQEFGFKAYFHGDLTEPITLSFTDMPLLKSLQLLTANQSLSVATRPGEKGAEPGDAKQPAEIWVLSRSTKNNPPAMSAAAPIISNPGGSEVADAVGADSIDQVVEAQVAQLPVDQPGQALNEAENDKQQTIANLAASGDSAAIMAMAEFTRDVDAEIRRISVSSIGSVHSAESTNILGRVLHEEPEAEIRRIAVQALGERKHEATARTFLEDALNDTDAEIKTLARQLLAQ